MLVLRVNATNVYQETILFPIFLNSKLGKNKKIPKGTLVETEPRILTCVLIFTQLKPHGQTTW